MTAQAPIELDLVIRYTIEKPVDQFDEFENYLMRITAKIYAVVCDAELTGDHPEHIKLGDVSFIRIQVTNALNEGYPLNELFDESQRLTDLAKLIFSPDMEEYSTQFIDNFTGFVPMHGGDLLVLDDVNILPFAKDQHLEPIVLRACVRDWQTGCDFAMVEPNPEWISSSDAQMAGFKVTSGMNYQFISMSDLQIIPDLPNTIQLTSEVITEQLNQ